MIELSIFILQSILSTIHYLLSIIHYPMSRIYHQIHKYKMHKYSIHFPGAIFSGRHSRGRGWGGRFVLIKSSLKRSQKFGLKLMAEMLMPKMCERQLFCWIIQLKTHQCVCFSYVTKRKHFPCPHSLPHPRWRPCMDQSSPTCITTIGGFLTDQKFYLMRNKLFDASAV